MYSPYLDSLHNLQFSARVGPFYGKNQKKPNEDHRSGQNLGHGFDEATISNSWLSTLDCSDRVEPEKRGGHEFCTS